MSRLQITVLIEQDNDKELYGCLVAVAPRRRATFMRRFALMGLEQELAAGIGVKLKPFEGHSLSTTLSAVNQPVIDPTDEAISSLKMVALNKAMTDSSF